jgi:hypothetical protein
VEVAAREARNYKSEAHAAALILLGIDGIILSAMAFFRAPVEWMIVVGFLLSTLIICQLIVEGIGRLDAGRAYLEQVCHDMNERLARMHWQMPR